MNRSPGKLRPGPEIRFWNNPGCLHTLTWLPLFVVGLTALLLGLVWLTVRQPWLLDQAANETLLQTSFEELFAAGINARLPKYLLLSYRFFGWWLFSLGLLLITYIQVTRLGTRPARRSLQVVVLLVLAGLIWIEWTFIPASPFVWLSYGLLFLWLVSVTAGLRLERVDTTGGEQV